VNTRPRTTAESRFWKHVVMLPDAPGCWLWVGATASHGYGNIETENRREMVLSHRLSYEMHKGPIPDGLLVRHRCDTRCCVNPEHLEVGTQKDNLRDMVERGRASKGPERGTRWKLTAADVIAIREAGRTGVKHRDIARQFNMSQAQVSKIIARDAWAWLQEAA